VGRTLRRIEAGSGRPDVVLEAGRNDVATSWSPVMDRLAPYLHVIAYDRAGLGASPPATDPVIVARQVADLTSVITTATTGRCVLAGHSWGGLLVQLVAIRRPDLVAGLVLVDPAHEQLTEALPGVARLGLRLARLGRSDELRGGDTAASLALLHELRRTEPSFPDVPVVVLSASRGFPRQFQKRWTELQAGLAASAPRGRHVVVHGTGHQIHRQRPDVVAGAIRQVAAEAGTGGAA
jgi:pimeloyl-ACP methyl ester carboxylesterase